ncbi:MAG: amidohydrolase family protein [Bacteroidota bacterium]
METLRMALWVLLSVQLLQCGVPPSDLGIVVGTLIDGTGNDPKHDVVVVVDAGRIRAILPKSEFDSHFVQEVIDASDKVLIPGLFDMHGHVTMARREVEMKNGRWQFTVSFRRDVAEWMLRQLLFYGITTIRETADSLEETLRLKNDLSKGSIPGPRMFTCGPLIEAAPPLFRTLSTVVSSEAEARAEVRRQVEAGVDFLKIYASLQPHLARAVVDEAHRLNKRVLGHLGATTWKEATEMGVDGIVHAHNVTPRDILREDQLSKIENLPFPQNQFVAYELFDPTAKPAQELFQMMREKKVANDPTLVVFRNYTAAPDFLSEEQGEETNAVPPFMREGWQQELSVTGPKSDSEYEEFLNAIEHMMRFVRAAYEAGVTILAGSDFANPNTLPGLSLHQELELLVEAGIPPLTVLKIATRDAADYLGILVEVGTVEPGKQADLLILSKDPLENIRNTREIFSVIQAGQVVEGKAL